MQSSAQPFISAAEYLAGEEKSPVKHEYFNGRIYAMFLSSNKHALLCAGAGATLRDAVRGTDFRAVGSDQCIKIESTGLYTYPDAAAYCLPARFEGRVDQLLLSPQLIIEVLSPSTEKYDRAEKFEHYKQIPELTDYLLIEQERVLVQHFARHPDGGWLLRSYNEREDCVVVAALNIALPLAQLYEDVDVPSGWLPLRSADGSGEI